MTLFDRLTIRSRLLIAVLVPVLLTAIGIAWYATSEFTTDSERQVQRLGDQVVQARKEGLRNLVEFARATVMEVKNDPRYSEAEAKEEARARLRSLVYDKSNYVFAYTYENGNLFNLAYRPDPGKEGTMTSASRSVKSLIADLFNAAGSGGFHGYIWPNPATGNDEPKVSYTTIIPGWDWMIGTGVYLNDVDAVVNEAKASVDEDVSRMTRNILLIGAALVAVGVIAGLMVGTTITRPLKKFSDTMQDIADGEGDLTSRLPDDGNNELALLGRRFNAFVSRIQDTVRDVGVTTSQLNGAAVDLKGIAEVARESVQVQGDETDQIATAINEMAATIQQIAGNANEVESAASDADRLAKEGGQTIVSAQSSMTELSSDIENSAQSISMLASKTTEIQKVLDVIRGVTDQTNLLALNAAIEAARAGEHGRGFSVVADEVRQLAQRSSASADEISEMINGFVEESEKAMAWMEQSRTRSNETVERIDYATQALRTIEGSVGQIHNQVTQIATGSEEQSHVAEEINRNVIRIVEAAQKSSDSVTNTNEASAELSSLGDTLNNLVSRFKV